MVNNIKNLSWDLGFVRSINDWEIERITSMLAKIEEVPPTRHATNSFVWCLGKEGKFSAKSFYFSHISWYSPPLVPLLVHPPLSKGPYFGVWSPSQDCFFVEISSLNLKGDVVFMV